LAPAPLAGQCARTAQRHGALADPWQLSLRLLRHQYRQRFATERADAGDAGKTAHSQGTCRGRRQQERGRTPPRRVAQDARAQVRGMGRMKARSETTVRRRLLQLAALPFLVLLPALLFVIYQWGI